MSETDILGALPLLTMTVGSLLLLVLGMFKGESRTFSRILLGCGVCVVALYFSLPYLSVDVSEDVNAFGGFIRLDPFTFIFYCIILGGTILTLLLSEDALEGQRVKSSVDFDVLVLLASIGAMVMVASTHLLVLFLGLELLSISVYALTASARNEKASSEGALKYFILGSFSSAFLLYGMMLVYAATGSMQIGEIGQLLSSENHLLLIGLGLLVFGFGFKVSLVPFHFWTPDVYQGAPTTVTGFMAVVVKAAAFGAFLRLMLTAFGGISEGWIGLIWILSVLTMTIGNVVALRQESLKRMLAYSSIAHAGYAMIGFLGVDSSSGGSATIFYILTYSLMTIAAFGVVLVVTLNTDEQYEQDKIESLSGLGWSRPVIGFVMTISMLSLAGMPPLAGFIGKFYLISSAIGNGYTGLAVIAVLNSVISLYYYLRVVVVMYFSTSVNEVEDSSRGIFPNGKMLLGPRMALVIATFGTIYLGIFSWPYVDIAKSAIKGLG